MGIYIVDKDLNILPDGIVGEIVVSGDGVGRGYLNREDITKERFLDDPYNAGQRLYKSGDLARFTNGADLEYLGRMDHQIQLRGFRVELGEIESTLRKHEQVQDAVAVAHSDENGDKYICAYIILKPETEINLQSIRDYITANLPYYMMPSEFKQIQEIPLTGNGKRDTKKIAESAEPIKFVREIVHLEGEAEEGLAAIWRKTLNTEEVGANDSFFDLGGNSLRALKVVAEMQGRISLADIFKQKTIRNLAKLLDEDRKKTILKPVSATQEGTANLVCVPYAGGDIADYDLVSKSLAEQSPDVTVYALNFPGGGFTRDQDMNGKTLREVAEQVVTELKELSGPTILYGHCVGTSLALEIGRQLEKEGMPAEEVILGGITLPHLDPADKILDPWAGTTDDELVGDIVKLGGFDELPDLTVMEEILSNFRHDVRLYRQYLYEFVETSDGQKMQTPIVCLYGTKDPATENKAAEHDRWRMFGDNLGEIILEGADHYFIKKAPSLVAEIVAKALHDSQKSVLKHDLKPRPQ